MVSWYITEIKIKIQYACEGGGGELSRVIIEMYERW